MASFGKMYVSALLAEGNVALYLQAGNITPLFRESELPAYKYVQEHVKKFQSLPHAKTVELHTGDDLDPHVEGSAYYLDLMRKRALETGLKAAMVKVAGHLKADLGSKDPQLALNQLAEDVLQLVAHGNGSKVHDFRDAYTLIMTTFAQKHAIENTGLKFGWPKLDESTGGVQPGEMVSLVGRPAAGKTWFMLSGAYYGWHAAGEALLKAQMAKQPITLEDQSRLFVSMEMKSLLLQQRLAAMHAKVPVMDLQHASLTTGGLTRLKQGMKVIQGYGAPFYIVDGNLTATVEDIWMLAKQLKPAAIFIDGAYLIKHPTERDRYRRVAENADLIKSELCAIAPCVCSWQFARGGKKKPKQGDQPGLDDIGYTDAIAQVSSIVLALLQEESVETLKHRVISVLKGRSGETGQFMVHWDHVKMNFREVLEEIIENLQFVG